MLDNNQNNDAIEYYDVDVEILDLEVESALDYRRRRQPDWTDNYTLYRDKVITNRLTQRQTVNIPLMKYTLNTVLKDVDDPPLLYFANLDNNDQAEVFYNEYWKETARREKLELRDVVDKKQAFLYGRAFKKLNIVDGRVKFSNVPTEDMLVHMHTDPIDMDSSPCVIQTGIFRTLRSILDNEDYDEDIRERLRAYYDTEEGQLDAEETHQALLEKNEKMQAMGFDSVLDPVLGETYIELYEMYRYEEDEEGGKGNILFLSVYAVPGDRKYKLSKDRLCDVIGNTADNFWYNHLPYNTWGVDPEAEDFWNDSIADIIRPLNKVLNAWISQLVENRTLRNFGMTFYDSSDKSFVPQIFNPTPWGFYPVPGNPREVMQSVDIPDLSESLDEIKFLIEIAEKATAASTTSAGSVQDQRVTLGEVELALANAKERVQSLRKFYTEGWKDFGLKYIKVLEAADDLLDPMIVSRQGRLTKRYYRKEIIPANWRTEAGFTTEVKMQMDKQAEDVEGIQKLKIAKAEMPDNVPLDGIYKRKLLEFCDLTADEINQVEEFEMQKADMPVGIDQGMLQAGGEMPSGEQPAMVSAGVGSQAGGIPNMPQL